MNLDCCFDLLRKMVAVPSLSYEEEEVRALICSTLDDMGISHTVLNGNILALNRNFDPDKKTLALDAHMDTVPAASSYTRDPHDAGNDSDIIWGLGSNDDGGSVVSMIAAFSYYYERTLPFNLMLVITREEERSGEDGARWIYADNGSNILDEGFPYPDWVIVGEPTGMRAATSERGLLVLDGTAHGVSGHAARNEGLNALYIALDDIQKLRAHKFRKHSELMGEVKLTVTQINAGTAHNVVPDNCTFVVDIRPTEKYTNAEILSELQAECISTLKARNLLNGSSATKAGSPLLRTIDRLGIETFSSPTTSDWMRIDCDAIKMGPGESSRSHKADEFIRTSEIADAVGKYIQFIETFYGNTLE